MSTIDAGLTTLGVRVAWALEETAGQKPANSGSGSSLHQPFTEVKRVNQIGGVSIDTENIDVSALVDYVTRYKPGRADTGGSFPITVNVTSDTISQWNTIITTYYNASARTAGKRMWWQIVHPELTDAFFIVAAPPKKIPVPETAQNEAWTIEINLVIDELIGYDTAVPFAYVDGEVSA